MNFIQLALEISLKDDATFDSYYKTNNEMAYACIVNIAQGKGEQFIYLWGGTGVGKTHLLQAACHFASEREISAVYLPLETIITSFAIDRLSGLENVDLVCLDNIQAIAARTKWEERLFHLFNNIKNNQNKLLIAADRPPMQINLDLLDLKSRLSSGVVYQLHDLEDEAKLMVLQSRAKSKGLELDYAVGRFLLRRCSRSMSHLCAALEKLDKASLAKQRKLTMPFVKQVLNI